MTDVGKFFGVGVGPGPAGLIPLAAWEALKQCDLILTPRAESKDVSTARQCLAGLDIPDRKFKEVIFSMDSNRASAKKLYSNLAKEIADDLISGKSVAYLTIGDSLTYSTYSYLLAVLTELLPNLNYVTFPGITSYAAIAATFDWPLGQGKERTLILPCPDDLNDLGEEIEKHDVVVLMKIGHRLTGVIEVLRQKGIAEHCVFASRLGLPGEKLSKNISSFNADDSYGYLSTMLIRKSDTKEVTV